MYRILDLDNCISNDGWRIPRIRWDASDHFTRYDSYHQLAAFDECANRQLFDKTNDKIIILTGRPERYRALTEEWLRRWRVMHVDLFMRSELQDRAQMPSCALKEITIKDILKYNKVSLAIDDRQDIVDMYSRLGIKAQCIKIHNVDAYKNQLTGKIEP